MELLFRTIKVREVLMRILLVRPPQPAISNNLKYIMTCEPLELEYVAAAVPAHDRCIHDMMIDEDLVRVLRRFRPHVVGTSCYINNVREAIEVCRVAKGIDARITTVIGGVHAALNPQDFEDQAVDFVVQGEGMTTFRELVATLEAKDDPATVSGIGYRRGEQFVYTDRRPFPKDVDQFPFPARELTRHYRNEYFYRDWRPLSLLRTSWGCPYQCTFCYNRELSDDRYLARSPESVVEELETLPGRHVYVIDDTFLFNKKRLERLHELIKERGIRKEYLVYGRTDFVANNMELLKKWEEIGLRMVRVGLESVDGAELDRYNKKSSIENNNRAIEVLNELNIDVFASFILAPEYGREEFRKLRDYIRESGIAYLFLNPLTPLPGTPLFETYRDRLIVPPSSAYALWDFQHCVIKPEKLSLFEFYLQKHLTYLVAFNPRRHRKVRMRPKPPLFSRVGATRRKALVYSFLEMLLAHRHHRFVEKPPKTGPQGG